MKLNMKKHIVIESQENSLKRKGDTLSLDSKRARVERSYSSEELSEPCDRIESTSIFPSSQKMQVSFVSGGELLEKQTASGSSAGSASSLLPASLKPNLESLSYEPDQDTFLRDYQKVGG